MKAVRDNSQSISYENRELREEVAKGYCLIKKIEELEGLERKLSEENKQLQQKLTLADEDIEKYQKELAKCSSVHESENKCWHEKVNKLEQELRVVRANLQTTTKRNTELNDLKIKLEEEEKQKEKLLLKQKSEFEEKATRLVKLEDEITRLKTAAKEAAEGREIGEAAHCNLEEGSQGKDEKLVEIEHTVMVRNTIDDQVPIKPESSIFCHYFNNDDACRFILITGRQCRFLHRRSPKCRFGFACNRKKCMYVHDIPRWPLLPTQPPSSWQLPQSPPFPWQHSPPIWRSTPPPRTLQQFWQD